MDVGGGGGEERVDELAESAAEGVGEGGNGGGGDTAAWGEPEGGVVGWGAEDEWLGEADEDLAEHDGGEGGRGGSSAGVADPIAGQDKEGGGDECEAGAAGVEGIDGEWRSNDEGEEEGRAEPVYDGGGGGEVGGCCVGDRGVRKPLGEVISNWEELGCHIALTDIPADNDVHQDQLYETEPAPFIYAVYRRRLSIFLLLWSSIKIGVLPSTGRVRTHIFMVR